MKALELFCRAKEHEQPQLDALYLAAYEQAKQGLTLEPAGVCRRGNPLVHVRYEGCKIATCWPDSIRLTEPALSKFFAQVATLNLLVEDENFWWASEETIAVGVKEGEVTEMMYNVMLDYVNICDNYQACLDGWE